MAYSHPLDAWRRGTLLADEGNGTRNWCTAGNGILSIPLLALGVVVFVAVAAVGVEAGRAVADWTGIGSDGQALVTAFTLLCTLLAIWLLEAPVFSYLTVGQAKRIQLIKGYFSPALIARYFDEFWRGREEVSILLDKCEPPGTSSKPEVAAELRTRFDKLLQDDFGPRVYLMPVLALSAVASIVLFFGFSGGIALAQQLAYCGTDAARCSAIRYPLGIKLDLVSVAAIFGAYTWIASDSITRNHQGALHPSDLGWYALRLVVAIPLGESLSMFLVKAGTDATATGANTLGPAVAFVLSMFSFERISQILSSLATKAVGAPSGTPAERDDLVLKLPGVDEATANRLAAEGITTVSQMGAADPVRVSIRTSLPFDFVLGLIDASLLWNYVGGKLDTLRSYGLKGVSSLLAFRDHGLAHEAPSDRQIADYDAKRKTASGARATADAAAATLALAKNAFLRASMDRARAEQALAQAQLAGPGPELNAATADDITAANALDQAKSGLDAAQVAVGQCAAALEIALRELGDARAALVGPGSLLSDAAKKAGMDESALRNVAEAVARDGYADFIRRLSSSAPPS